MRIYIWIVIFYDVFERWGFCEDDNVAVVVLFWRVVILCEVFERWGFCEDVVNVGVFNVVFWEILGCLRYYLRGYWERCRSLWIVRSFLWRWSRYHCRWCRRDYWGRCRRSLWIFRSVLLLRFLWKWNRCHCRWCHRFVSLGCLCLCWYLRGCWRWCPQCCGLIY